MSHDHPILQVQPGSGVMIMKASPGIRFSGRVMMTEWHRRRPLGMKTRLRIQLR
jgi:hypothetical protein